MYHHQPIRVNIPYHAAGCIQTNILLPSGSGFLWFQSASTGTCYMRGSLGRPREASLLLGQDSLGMPETRRGREPFRFKVVLRLLLCHGTSHF
jgi:hypothetical protein